MIYPATSSDDLTFGVASLKNILVGSSPILMLMYYEFKTFGLCISDAISSTGSKKRNGLAYRSSQFLCLTVVSLSLLESIVYRRSTMLSFCFLGMCTVMSLADVQEPNNNPKQARIIMDESPSNRPNYTQPYKENAEQMNCLNKFVDHKLQPF
ncbi:hypothetical protein VNO80_05454 [Phaseolus coccineus]|uniref:Uncharacterized protein n=1 Tax=Phaseolus coccineus TaxID=3886 RepID=A0AAN9NFZ8_PHACN